MSRKEITKQQRRDFQIRMALELAAPDIPCPTVRDNWGKIARWLQGSPDRVLPITLEDREAVLNDGFPSDVIAPVELYKELNSKNQKK